VNLLDFVTVLSENVPSPKQQCGQFSLFVCKGGIEAEIGMGGFAVHSEAQRASLGFTSAFRALLTVFSLTLFLDRIISSTLKMEATPFSETSVNNKSTWCHIPQDGILHSHRCENLKSCINVII
jgi:hypothetical protein